MNITLEKLDEIIGYLTEADKAISSTYAGGVPTRDAIMFSQSTVWFKIGLKDEKAMAAGLALYNKTMVGLKTSMFDIYSKVSSGQLNYTQALGRWKQFTGQFYIDFFKSGAMSMGNPFYAEMGPTRRDLAIISRARRYEEKFFKRYLNDIIKQRSGKFTPADEARWARHPLDVRSGYYADSGKAQFYNGMVAGAGDDVEIFWRLGIAEHCDLCPIYAQRSYTWSTLPTIPRSGDTPCLFNCKCELEIKPRPKTTPTSGPFAPTAPGKTTTPGEGASTRFPSGAERVGGELLAGIDDMFSQMNKIRQMIGLETNAVVKAELILQRKLLNQDIIKTLADKKIRVVPKISVADLMTAAKDAQARAGVRVDNWSTLKSGQETYVLTGTVLRKGLIQFSPNGKPILLSSDGRFLLDQQYDIVFKAKKSKAPVAIEPSAIAPEIGAPAGTPIKSKVIKFQPYGTEENLYAYLKSQIDKGRTWDSLAKEFDCSPSRVYALYRKYNVIAEPLPIPPTPLPIPPMPIPKPISVPTPVPVPVPEPAPRPEKPLKSTNPKIMAYGTEEKLVAYLKAQHDMGKTWTQLANEFGEKTYSRIYGYYKKYYPPAGKVSRVPGEPWVPKALRVPPVDPFPPGSMKQVGILKPPQFTSYAQAERYLIDNGLIEVNAGNFFKIQSYGKIGFRPIQRVIQFDVRELQVIADTYAQLKNSLGIGYKKFNLFKVRNYENAHYHDSASPYIVFGDKIEAYWKVDRLKNTLSSLKYDVEHYGRLYRQSKASGQPVPGWVKLRYESSMKNYREMRLNVRAIENKTFDRYQQHSNFATGAGRELEGTAFHEYGHLFEFKFVAECKMFMQQEMGWNFQAAPREWGNQQLTTYQMGNLSVDSRYMLGITNRATCNYKEMWAENFALFNMGKWERLHPKVVKFLRQFMPDVEPIDLSPELKKVFMQLTEPTATTPWAKGGGKAGIQARAKSMDLAARGFDVTGPFAGISDDLLKHSDFKSYVQGLKSEIEMTPSSLKIVDQYVKQAKEGHLDPIVVDKNNINRVVDGNHRLVAAKQAGVTPRVYAVDRIDFIRGAAREGEMVYLNKLIAQGKALDVNSGMLATAKVKSKSIDQTVVMKPTAFVKTGKPEPISRSIDEPVRYKDPKVETHFVSSWSAGKEKLYTNKVLKQVHSLPVMDAMLVKNVFLVDNQTARAYFGQINADSMGIYQMGSGRIGYNVYWPLSTKTISHEIGHAVYFQALSTAEKQAIAVAYREAKAAKRFVTKYAGYNSEEFFAENYAYYHESMNARKFVNQGIKFILDARYGK